MTATLTLAALLQYRPDILDNLQLPHVPTAAEMGVEANQIRQTWAIDPDDFADFLCFHTMGMSLAIPDADYIKSAVGVWSASHVHEWQRMFDTLFYKYNPLWNKDAKTTESDLDERDVTAQGSHNQDVAGNNKATGYTNGYDGGSSTETDPITENSGRTIAWTHADKTINNASSNSSGWTHDASHDRYSHSRIVAEQGNIGVTQVQQMIDAERETAKYNIEEIIAEAFKNAFCIQVY